MTCGKGMPHQALSTEHPNCAQHRVAWEVLGGKPLVNSSGPISFSFILSTGPVQLEPVDQPSDRPGRLEVGIGTKGLLDEAHHPGRRMAH